MHLANIYRLLIKELRSIRSDPIMLVLVAYAFTIAIYAAATGASTEATNLPSESSTKTVPTCHAALRTASRPHVQACRADRSDGNRPVDGFATIRFRH